MVYRKAESEDDSSDSDDEESLPPEKQLDPATVPMPDWRADRFPVVWECRGSLAADEAAYGTW
jgi:hypothetical protein